MVETTIHRTIDLYPQLKKQFNLDLITLMK